MHQPSSRHRFYAQLSWLGVAPMMAGLIAVGSTSALAQATHPRTTAFELNQAVCANDWNQAISITSNLLANVHISDAQRTELITLRRQMEQYRAEGAVATDEQACNQTNPYFLEAQTPETPPHNTVLGWEGAIAEVTENQYNSEVITESPVASLPVRLSDQPGLTPAEPIDLSRGLAAVSGHVGSGHEVYAFVAGMGDQLDINLEVTRVMTGSLYTTDDSQLFIFDKNGRLLTAVDDTDEGKESRISGWVVPETDVYFAVVTSYNNDPIFNQDDRVVGWQGNGGGRFDYTLSVSGATPTNALVR